MTFLYKYAPQYRKIDPCQLQIILKGFYLYPTHNQLALLHAPLKIQSHKDC